METVLSAWRMTEPTDSNCLITIPYISYNKNKEDSDAAEQYSNTCLLQLSLNWIEPAALGLRVFFHPKLTTSCLNRQSGSKMELALPILEIYHAAPLNKA
jgi:hypothetical protein